MTKYRLKKELHQYVEVRVQQRECTEYEWLVLGWKPEALVEVQPIGNSDSKDTWKNEDDITFLNEPPS